MSNHTHQFSDPHEFVFEDILVAELLICDDEFCEYEKPVQYEVIFDSFERDGERLSTKESKKVWQEICDTVGPTVRIDGERWESGSVTIQTQSGRDITFNYGDDYQLQGVQLQIDGATVDFHVMKYRELDPREI